MAGFTEKVTIEVIADTKKASSDLEDVADDLKAISEKPAEVEVKADTSLADRALLDVQGEIKELDKKIQIDIDVSEAGLKKAKHGLDSVDDSINNVQHDAPSSIGAIRDVGGAFGDVGGGALDAAEGILGFGETLGQLSPKLAGVGAALGKLGFIGAIGGLGLNLLVEGINQLNGSSAAVEGGIKKITSAVNDGGVAFESYAKGAANSVSVGEVLKSNVFGLGSTLQKIFGQAVPSAGDRLKSFKKVLEESAPAAAALITELQKTGKIDTDELEKYTKLLDDQQRNSALVAGQNKELETTQTLYNEAVAAGIDITGKSADAIRDELAELKLRESVSHQTAEGIASDQDRIAKAMEAAATAGVTANQKNREETDKLRDSIDKLNAALDEQHGAVLSEAEARVRSTDAQTRYNDSVKEGKSSVDELTVSAIDVAEAYADVLEQNAKANGQSFTTEQRQKAIQASLQSTADKAKGPLKDALDGLVKDYDEIPETVHTDATMNADQALAELNALIRKLQIAQQEIDIMKFKAANVGVPIGVLGSTPNSTSTTIINYPPTLSPVKVQAAVAQGNARNGALKR